MDRRQDGTAAAVSAACPAPVQGGSAAPHQGHAVEGRATRRRRRSPAAGACAAVRDGDTRGDARHGIRAPPLPARPTLPHPGFADRRAAGPETPPRRS